MELNKAATLRIAAGGYDYENDGTPYAKRVYTFDVEFQCRENVYASKEVFRHWDEERLDFKNIQEDPAN